MDTSFGCFLDSECMFVDEAENTLEVAEGTFVTVVDGWTEGDDDSDIRLKAHYTDDAGRLWTAELSWDALVPDMDTIRV